jgi:acyl carrier protein
VSIEQDLRAEVVALIREKLRYTGEIPAGDLAEQLDSMDRLALVVAIEDKYKVAFDGEDDDNIRTLDDLVGALARKRAG